MNEGVLMILERMKTNPEEFVGKHNRWESLIDHYRHVLTDEEFKSIKNVKDALEREEFTRSVMQEILREPTPVEIDPNTYTINRMGTTAEQLRALRLQNTYHQQLATQEQLDRIRAEHPFEPFCGEVK